MPHPGLRAGQYITEWLGVLTLIILVVIFSLTGSMLPAPVLQSEDVLPIRPALLVLFLLAMAIDGITLLLSRVRGMFRYPVEVTGANVEFQYLLAKVMLGAMACITNAYTVVAMILVYEQRILTDGWGFLALATIAAILYALTWLIYYMTARRGG